MPERPRTERLGAVALTGLLGLALGYLLTAEPAPTIRILWRDDVSAARQAELEHAYLLVDGGFPNDDAPRSLAYALLDTSRGNIKALVNDPAIADTHHVDRSGYTVDADAVRSVHRMWLAHRLPGLRRAPAQWMAFAALAAVAIGGLRRRLAVLARAVAANATGALATGSRSGRVWYAAAAGVVGWAVRRLPTRARDVPLMRDWLSPAGTDDPDWFDTWRAQGSSPDSRPGPLSWAAKLVVASAIVAAIGVPILSTWQALLLTACLLGLIFGVAKPQLWRVAAAVAIALGTVAITSTLPRADIAEGHNAFLVTRDGEALQRGLPAPVFQSWKAQLDAIYPPDPVRDAAPFQWRHTPEQNVPAALFTQSADAIWREARYSRQVDTIAFRSLGEFRGGFVNESELHGAAHTIRYNFWAGPLDRRDMPFFVMYELTPASVGSRLIWKGQAFWQRVDGDVEEIVHQRSASRTITPDDAGARVYAAFFPARDRDLQFAMQPSPILRLSAWAGIVLSVIASIGVLLLTTRVRWNAVARAAVILASGYAVLVTHADFQVDHLGGPYPPHAGGDDGLVHDGWGRMMAMLVGQGEIGEALRGAESVYWFTPGMRYFRMVEKLIFGDTNHLHTLAIVLVPLVLFYLVRSFLRPRAAWMVTAAFCLVQLGNLSLVQYVAWARAGYGESVAGGLFLLGLALMLRTQPRWGGQVRNLAAVWAAGAALAASMFIRPNFALAVVWLGAAYAWSCLRGRDAAASAAFACGLGLALWMPLHNWYYGGELYLISRSVENVALTIGVADYTSALGDVIAGRFDTQAVAVTSAQISGWLWNSDVAAGGAPLATLAASAVRLLGLAAACWVALRAMAVRASTHYAALKVMAGAALLLHVPMLFAHATLDRYAVLGWELSLLVLICAAPVEAALFEKRSRTPLPDTHDETAAHSRP